MSPLQNSALTGGQVLVRALADWGITTIFGIPGAGQYEAIDALYNEPRLRYISVRNEQAATFMADGYARASGKFAAALLVPGPGLYNATSGMATAYASSSPLLVITGSRKPTTPDRDSDELTIMKRLTKWSGAAQNVADIPDLVSEAIYHLTHGTPQPVGLEISPRIFAGKVAADIAANTVARRNNVSPGVTVSDELQPRLTQAARLITQAAAPVIWAGAGVQRAAAWHALQQLAEQQQIPVVTSKQGKGVISDRHPLSLGLAEMRYAPLRTWLANRDLIIVVGSSVDLSAFSQPIIRIDTDPTRFDTQENVLTIAGDANEFLPALNQLMVTQQSDNDESMARVHAEVHALNQQRFAPAVQLSPQRELMRAIRHALPEDGILVQGMNQMGYYSRNYFPVYAPRAYLTSSSHATLGAAWPLAVGAQVAQPDRAVVALSGDGGFLYNAQELATAVQYNIPAVVIVFNDNAYGNVLRAQIEEFDGHIIGTKLHNPDFVKLAESYGVRGLRSNDADQLSTMLKTALDDRAPTLIEVPVGPMERVY